MLPAKYRTHIFAGTECDILPDGSLDFSDDTLKQFDFVIVSVHASLRQDEKTMTKRLIRAIEHPLSMIVGHVTGRLLLRREPYAVNMAKVIDACIANGKIMELNAQPQRLEHGLEVMACSFAERAEVQHQSRCPQCRPFRICACRYQCGTQRMA